MKSGLALVFMCSIERNNFQARRKLQKVPAEACRIKRITNQLFLTSKANMNTRITAMLVLAALTAAGATYAADTKTVTETIKEKVGDTVITTKIKAEYAKDKDVSALKIKVDTDDKGAVTLSGNASTRTEADKAVRIARDTKGVSSVKDDIKVQGR